MKDKSDRKTWRERTVHVLNMLDGGNQVYPSRHLRIDTFEQNFGGDGMIDTSKKIDSKKTYLVAGSR